VFSFTFSFYVKWFPVHTLYIEQRLVLRVLFSPKPCVERDKVVAYFEVPTRRYHKHFPANSVDDKPVADLAVSVGKRLKAEAFKVRPYGRVVGVPLIKRPLPHMKLFCHLLSPFSF
jgi:hypothetical protein